MNLWRGLAKTTVAHTTYYGCCARCLSTVKTPSANYDSPLSYLRRALKKSLRRGEYQSAAEAFRKHMTTTKLRNQSRFETFESVASLFLKYGETNSAKAACARMQNEGFIPSVRLKASMAVLHGYHAQHPVKSVLAAAQKAMALEGFDESTLRFLLAIMYVNLPCSSDHIEGVVGEYLKSCPADRKLSKSTCLFLSYLHTRLGSLDLATKWRPISTDKADKIMKRDQRLLALANSDPEVQTIVQAAILRLRLKKSFKEHDRMLYNYLIQHSLAKQRYQRAFQIYKLMLSGAKDISPDATTFTHLFDAWTAASKSRSFRSRKHKWPLDAPSPRAIFREMIHRHHLRRSEEPSATVGITALIAALRTFMKTYDYAAAFVILRTIRLCMEKAPIEAYSIIIDELILRIHRELRFSVPSHSPLWSHRFLARPSIANSAADAHILVEGLLNMGLQPTLAFAPVYLPIEPQLHAFLRFSGPPEARKAAVKAMLELAREPHRVPGPLVVIGMLKAWDDRWDITPLERIMRRAILAKHAKLYVPPAKAVSQDVAEAKAAMIWVAQVISDDSNE